jgi:hypothetical protein
MEEKRIRHSPQQNQPVSGQTAKKRTLRIQTFNFLTFLLKKMR